MFPSRGKKRKKAQKQLPAFSLANSAAQNAPKVPPPVPTKNIPVTGNDARKNQVPHPAQFKAKRMVLTDVRKKAQIFTIRKNPQIELQPLQTPLKGCEVWESTNKTTWQQVDEKKTETQMQEPQQSNWTKHDDNKSHFQNTFVEADDKQKSTEEVNASPSGSNANKDITWELNTVDDNEHLTTHSDPGPKKLEVVQGKASEIKLFIQNKKDKSITVQKPVQEAVHMDKKITPSNTNTNKQRGSMSSSTKSYTIPMGLMLTQSYPKGIPRSFLVNQNQISIQPQGQVATKPIQPIQTATKPPSNTWKAKPMTSQQYDKPTSVNQSQEGVENNQPYSPSQTYDDGKEHEGSESPSGSASKRLSAFQRLGPLSQPKKPKLTINLLCSKDESVREVVNQNNMIELDEKFTPVYLRKDMRDSNDELVVKYLPSWPWKRNVSVRKSVTARSSKSVMILEQEQMEEAYEKDNIFFQVSVRGYPPKWRKEDILDALLDNVKGKSFTPCFIDFKPEECRFLVIKCRPALLSIHKLGFFIRKDDVELGLTIGQTDLNLKLLDFIPRLILRKLLTSGYDGELKLSLREFTIGNETSHFIYFPLHRLTNQSELIQIQSTIAWNYITYLDLSHNRMTSIDGFELPITTPRLKHLDLSYNNFQKVTALLRNRELALRSIKLEGNPLCHDYIDPSHYVRVVKMIFPGLVELDGMPIHLKGDFPPSKKNYCPNEEAMDVASKFLDVFFPLLEMPVEERTRIEAMYDDGAVMTVTYRYSLRHGAVFRKFRNVLLRARILEEGDLEAIEGASAIARIISKWPEMHHDPYTFTVDVLYHTDYHTIVKIGGVFKLVAESLAEDEYLVAFTRTVVLGTDDGVEYKIKNEMVYWDEPCKELTNTAFALNSVRGVRRPLKLDLNNPDNELKEQLVEIFMHITSMEKSASERCLEAKEWNLKSALEYFMKLLKLDELDSLFK